MPACKKKNNRGLLLSLLALSLGLFVGAAAADFTVTSAQARLTDGGLRVEANLDLNLTDAAREAVNKGIPLDVAIELRLYEHRRIWWDPEVASWELHRRIFYHALSKRYIVSMPDEDDSRSESFESLDEAMNYMGRIEDYFFAFTNKVDEGRDYRVWLRASLDIESLPAPLRPVAYTSSAWRLQTGWKRWKIGD